MNPIRVEAEGPITAKIMIIGEAPGEEEVRLGRPFIGASGQLLDYQLASVGINRIDCYITNVVKVRPPANKLDRLGELGLQVRDYYPELYNEINSIRPNVIIALGNTPLEALTGLTSVTKYRGSILEGLPAIAGTKVIPSLHPAACLRTYTWTHILKFDLRRALAQSSFSTINRVNRTYIINPSFDAVIEELDRLVFSEYLSVDLETYMRSGLIRTIGLGDSATKAFCIPILNKMTPVWTEPEEKEIWFRLYLLLTNPTIKIIAQNAQFELTQLRPFTEGKMHIWMDTLRSHAIAYPEFPHSLAFLNSIYTDLPFYKDDGKISDEGSSSFDTLQIYNCKDVCVTYEIAMKLEDELKESGVWEFYHKQDIPLMHTLHRMQMHGVLIDQQKLADNKVRITDKIVALDKLFLDSVGYPVNPKSHKQMTTFLYDKEKGLGLPKKFKHGTSNLTANEEALTDLYQKTGRAEVKLLLETRQLRTLKETFLEMKLSPDGRIRTSYGVTETGRLSSSADVFDVGANLQNIPKRKGEWIREMFIPDPGKIWVKADLKQADARVVAWLADDIVLKRLFNSGQDIHKQVAALMFNKPTAEIIKEERELAKRAVHSTNYGIGPVTFAKNAGITKQKAEICISDYMRTFPNVRSVFQANVEIALRQNRTLITPFGRKRGFFDRYSDTLLREAYAYVPQSFVADYINLALPGLEAELPEGANILVQIHDEVGLQCFPKDLGLIIKLLKKHIERPVFVYTDYLTIPLDISSGPNWASTE